MPGIMSLVMLFLLCYPCLPHHLLSRNYCNSHETTKSCDTCKQWEKRSMCMISLELFIGANASVAKAVDSYHIQRDNKLTL